MIVCDITLWKFQNGRVPDSTCALFSGHPSWTALMRSVSVESAHVLCLNSYTFVSLMERVCMML